MNIIGMVNQRLCGDLSGRLKVFSAACYFALLLSFPCRSETTIQLNPDKPFNVSAKDDVQQLKLLAGGVGHEFSPNAETTSRLKKWGMKTIRVINVDPVEGKFDEAGQFTITRAALLDENLQTCREVGAVPHIIIGLGLHAELQLKESDVGEASLMGMVHDTAYGPKDWNKFRNYYLAFLEYVTVTKGFREVRFEVGNEADIGGGYVPSPPKPAMGSQAAYDAYLNVYKNIAGIVDDFQKSHPGLKISVGGPALSGAYTYRFGDFNWLDRFIRDCGLGKIRLDFFSFHYYGNISSLRGNYPAPYPSFFAMIRNVQAVRDCYLPGLPIWVTEWGPSYNTHNDELGAVNGNHIGAAFDAEFLNAMLEVGVDRALYLVTTDLVQNLPGGKIENNWGWPSLFVETHAYGGTFPKAPAHVFDMVSRLEGKRIEAVSKGSANVKCFASADAAKKKITIVLWNYNAEIPELTPAVEKAVAEPVALKVGGISKFFGAKPVRVERWLVAKNISDAYGLFHSGQKLDSRTELQTAASRVQQDKTGLKVDFNAPPSSVSFVVLSAK